MEVSWNGGTPKSSILMGFSYLVLSFSDGETVAATVDRCRQKRFESACESSFQSPFFYWRPQKWTDPHPQLPRSAVKKYISEMPIDHTIIEPKLVSHQTCWNPKLYNLPWLCLLQPNTIPCFFFSGVVRGIVALPKTGSWIENKLNHTPKMHPP